MRAAKMEKTPATRLERRGKFSTSGSGVERNAAADARKLGEVTAGIVTRLQRRLSVPDEISVWRFSNCAVEINADGEVSIALFNDRGNPVVLLRCSVETALVLLNAIGFSIKTLSDPWT